MVSNEEKHPSTCVSIYDVYWHHSFYSWKGPLHALMERCIVLHGRGSRWLQSASLRDRRFGQGASILRRFFVQLASYQTMVSSSTIIAILKSTRWDWGKKTAETIVLPPVSKAERLVRPQAALQSLWLASETWGMYLPYLLSRNP